MRSKSPFAVLAVAVLLALVGCSEDSSSTPSSTTTTSTAAADPAAAGGSCPTPDEADQIRTISETTSLQPVDAEVVASLGTVFDIQAAHVPPDLRDDVELTRTVFIGAMAEIEGLKPASLGDASKLSAEDRARVEAYQAAFNDNPEFLAANEAVKGYFATACPDFGV